MQQLVGYKLIDVTSGDVLQSWGGTWGQCPSAPEMITLTNGDIIYGLAIDVENNGVKLISWMMEPPAPTTQDIITERNRRLGFGFWYNFGTTDNPDYHHIGTTEQDMNGWSEVNNWANSQIALGNNTSTIVILTDSGSETVTALQWMEIVNIAASFRQPIWAASFQLADMTPIPTDYADNKYWPPISENPQPYTGPFAPSS